MPPPHAPPTPASSTDIRGKDNLISLAPVLSLPPSAYTETSDRTASSTPSANGSDSSYRPASPTSPINTQRKQSSASQSRVAKNDDAFALPPPPTRSRKIIQMKPKGSQATETQPDAAGVEISSSKGAAGAGRKAKGNTAGSTAQGRKIARKTAHSLIERRRRSKMNEEFGVLKDMIPACRGQEMHKLAILQASIDYLRYLEQCVTDLKSNNDTTSTSRPQLVSHNPAASISPRDLDEPMQNDTDASENEEMSEVDAAPTGTTTPSNIPYSYAQSQSQSQPQSLTSQHPSQTSLPSIASLTTQSAISPAIPALDRTNPSHGYRHYSISSASQASYSPYLHSAQASPFFGPSSYATTAQDNPANFALTSPALAPQDAAAAASRSGGQQPEDARRREQELDKEAMAALLMLNTDRRAWRDKSGRGMSVQDLLSN